MTLKMQVQLNIWTVLICKIIVLEQVRVTQPLSQYSLKTQKELPISTQ